jgi:asparagine synthase (glutamine-hydrolysing)
MFGEPVTSVRLGFPISESLSDRQIRDLLELSLPTLLRFEDRNFMGNSVESRLPFLDFRVVEFGVALPLAMKLNRGFGKWCLREIARDRLPREIRASRLKRGFDMAQDWIAAGLGAHMRDAAPSYGICFGRMRILSRDSPINVSELDALLRRSCRNSWLADQMS